MKILEIQPMSKELRAFESLGEEAKIAAGMRTFWRDGSMLLGFLMQFPTIKMEKGEFVTDALTVDHNVRDVDEWQPVVAHYRLKGKKGVNQFASLALQVKNVPVSIEASQVDWVDAFTMFPGSQWDRETPISLEDIDNANGALHGLFCHYFGKYRETMINNIQR